MPSLTHLLHIFRIPSSCLLWLPPHWFTLSQLLLRLSQGPLDSFSTLASIRSSALSQGWFFCRSNINLLLTSQSPLLVSYPLDMTSRRAHFFPTHSNFHTHLNFIHLVHSFIFSSVVISVVRVFLYPYHPSFCLLSSKKELTIPPIISCDTTTITCINQSWSPLTTLSNLH